MLQTLQLIPGRVLTLRLAVFPKTIRRADLGSIL